MTNVLRLKEKKKENNMKTAWRLSRSNLIWKGRSVNSLSLKMRSMRNTSCRISLFPPHEYIASASNVS